jgi:hypothetical protein
MSTSTTTRKRPDWAKNISKRPRRFMAVTVNTGTDREDDIWSEVAICESECLAWLAANAHAKGAIWDGFRLARGGVIDLDTGQFLACDDKAGEWVPMDPAKVL